MSSRKGRWSTTRDTIIEGICLASSRGSRSWLTVLGVAASVTGLVATVGIAQTSTYRLLARLESLESTVITASLVELADLDAPTLKWDFEERLASVEGIRAVGGLAVVQGQRFEIAGPATRNARRTESDQFEAMIATSGIAEALGIHAAAGSFFGQLHDGRSLPVVVLGHDIAEALDLPPVDGYTSVDINGNPHVVIGVLEADESGAQFARSILFPLARAREFGIEGPDRVAIRVAPGQTQSIASVLPRILSPASPQNVSAFVPTPPRDVTAVVENETRHLELVLSAITIALATLVISAVVNMTVLESRTEIGLRRALGATRLRVAFEFLIYSIWLGGFGGLAGTAVGVLIVDAVAIATGATPILTGPVAVLGPIVGLVTGIVAGVRPAVRVAHLEPAAALRAA